MSHRAWSINAKFVLSRLFPCAMRKRIVWQQWWKYFFGGAFRHWSAPFLFLSQNLIRINKGVIIFDTFICFVVDNPTMLERLERDVRQD